MAARLGAASLGRSVFHDICRGRDSIFEVIGEAIFEKKCRTCTSTLERLGVNYRRLSTTDDSAWSVKGQSAPVIAVGLSGGVDSSVAALLLKRQGFRVFGVYMRNWDPSDEVGGTACSAERDYEDARQVAKHLGIELYEVDNQRRYWTDVFESFTRDFSTGLTPNPDLACNRHIK